MKKHFKYLAAAGLIAALFLSAGCGDDAKDKQILVDISYMEELHTSNKKIYAMLERLDGIFSPFFRIGDRAFTCSSQMAVTDDIGHYMMTMAFTDTVPFEVPEPVGTKLEVDWRNRDGITGDHHQLSAEG